MGPKDARADRNPTGTPPSLPLVEGFLHVYIVVNERASMWFVTEDHENRWKTTLGELLPLAIDNLRRRTDLKHREKIPEMEAYFFSSGDSYDSARALLLRELLDPFPQNGVVVLMPTREHLVFTPVEHPDAWTNVAKLVGVMRRAYASAAYPVSDQAFWFDGERWALLRIDGEGDTFHMTAPQPFLDALGGKPAPK
jgi:uncharacterized protein YtpQ (UPF0354 family)